MFAEWLVPRFSLTIYDTLCFMNTNIQNKPHHSVPKLQLNGRSSPMSGVSVRGLGQNEYSHQAVSSVTVRYKLVTTCTVPHLKKGGRLSIIMLSINVIMVQSKR